MNSCAATFPNLKSREVPRMNEADILLAILRKDFKAFVLKSEPWLAEFEHELLSFPSVKHDDQVDSVSQFLQWHQRSWNNRIRVGKF